MNKTQLIIFKMSSSAILAALIFVCTRYFAIPYSLGGYFNFSDVIIIFSSIFFGPFEAILSGAIGCSIADLTSGYAVFVPFTLIAKTLEALSVWMIFYLLKKYKHIRYISIIIGPLFMIFTYFFANIILFSLEAAISNLPFDAIQGYVGALLGYLILKIFNKIKFFDRFKSKDLQDK